MLKALAEIEDAVFNNSRPELVELYERLLTDHIEAEETGQGVGVFPFSSSSRVALERALAFVRNCFSFAAWTAAVRRNEHDRGGISRLSDYPR